MISYKMNVYRPYDMWIMPGYLYGLFSNSSSLLSELWVVDNMYPAVGPQNRVPGAIDAALGGYQHKPEDNTYSYTGAPCDIPEDFRVYGGGSFWNHKGNGPLSPWTADSYTFDNGFWMTIPPNAKFLLFTVTGERYADWMSIEGYCRIVVDKDTDGDALPDSWEKQGIDFNKDGTLDLTLPGADFLKKDIYVEVDYMEGHRFSEAARDDVVAAFRNCPETVAYGPINLHVEIDDTDAGIGGHVDSLHMWTDFETLKMSHYLTQAQREDVNQQYIRTAYAYAYHYCLFIHGYSLWNGTRWIDKGPSGLGEMYHNDFVVSLGTFTDGNGTRGEQAATFMHELGHNLGLRHGGGDNVNYKPNYLSIMNYLFQFDGDPLKHRPLTFSSVKLASLDEDSLDETVGVKNANWDWTVYSGSLETTNGTRYVPLAVPTLGNIDWDNDGEDTETSVTANINNYPKWKYYSNSSEVLEGYNDWSNLHLYFYENQTVSEFYPSGSGKHNNVDAGGEELTWETVQAIREDAASMVGGPTGPVQIVPEFPSFIILPLFMMLTLLVIVLRRKQRVNITGTARAKLSQGYRSSIAQL